MASNQRGVNLLRAIWQVFGVPEPDDELLAPARHERPLLDSDDREGPPVKGDTR